MPEGDTLAPINLALQGGGSHGALTWGVLDALLEKHIEGEQSCAELIAAGFDAAMVQRETFGRERRYPITSGYAG